MRKQVYRVNADGTELLKIKDVVITVQPPWGQITNEVGMSRYDGTDMKTIYRSKNRLSVAWTPDSAWMVILDVRKMRWH